MSGAHWHEVLFATPEQEPFSPLWRALAARWEKMDAAERMRCAQRIRAAVTGAVLRIDELHGLIEDVDALLRETAPSPTTSISRLS